MLNQFFWTQGGGITSFMAKQSQWAHHRCVQTLLGQGCVSQEKINVVFRLLLMHTNVSNSLAHENKYPALPPGRLYLHFVKFHAWIPKLAPLILDIVISYLCSINKRDKKKVKQIGVLHPWGVAVHNKQWNYAVADFPQILLRAARLVSDTCGKTPEPTEAQVFTTASWSRHNTVLRTVNLLYLNPT